MHTREEDGEVDAFLVDKMADTMMTQVVVVVVVDVVVVVEVVVVHLLLLLFCRYRFYC